MLLALLAAIVASVGYGVASVLEAVAALRHHGARVFTRPIYLAGIALDLLAWEASLIALQRLTLFTVQALLSGSVVVTLLLARLVFSTRLGGGQIIAMLLLVGALVVVALATGVQPAARAPDYFTVMLMALLLVLFILLILSYRRGKPLVLAVVAGLAASTAALGARGIQLSDQLANILMQPVSWIVAGSGVVAMIAYSRALESGAVGAITALYTVIEVAFPGSIGMVLLDDAVRPGWEVSKFAALALALGCGVWLSLHGGAHPGAGNYVTVRHLRHTPRKARWLRTGAP